MICDKENKENIVQLFSFLFHLKSVFLIEGSIDSFIDFHLCEF